MGFFKMLLLDIENSIAINSGSYKLLFNFFLFNQDESKFKSHLIISSCNNVAPVTNLCLGGPTKMSHSSQWSKKINCS
jgi:hypothetical protein